MEKLAILNIYKCGSYVLYEVKPENFIEYGGRNIFYCFDYASLAKQWNMSKETLDAIASYDLQFKQSMYVNHQETVTGIEKTYLIHADVVPTLIKRAKDAGLEINTEEELFLIALITKGAKGGELKW